MIKISDFFPCERDAIVEYTYYSNSTLPNSACFVLNLEFLKEANNNEHISTIITTKELAPKVLHSKGLVVSDNPKKCFFELHNILIKNGLNALHVKSFIDDSAIIADTVKIEDNVHIGKNVIIEDFTVIKSNTIIEDETYIASNVVIGARGMHNTMVEGEFMYVKDAGGVHISKGCEVLSGAIIQKSYFSEFTEIGEQTKVSVGVKVGHGCVIGKRTLIAGSVQLAGYNTIGNDVWIGPSSVLAHGLQIGNNAQIKLGSVVVKNIKEGEEVSGNFAYTHSKRIRNFIKEQK